MRVGLIEFPRRSTLPNIALMRLSSWHKAQGDEVLLNATPLDACDRIYISTLFTWQRSQVEVLAAQFRPHADVQIGGSGWDLSLRLPAEVDAMPNDYDLFGIDYGIGYSSRGCIRYCGFCPVGLGSEGPRDQIREASAIGDLINPRSNRLILLDNNFFASDWRPKMREIEQRYLEVCWPQGLDIRLIDGEQAQALWDLYRWGQLWNQRFTKRGQMHFAWDNPGGEQEVRRGITALTNMGFKASSLIFYTLIGYRSTVEEELARIATLHALGIEPYVMVYRDFDNNVPRDPVRMDIQHWNNGHVWRKVSFNEYRRKLAS